MTTPTPTQQAMIERIRAWATEQLYARRGEILEHRHAVAQVLTERDGGYEPKALPLSDELVAVTAQIKVNEMQAV